MGSDIYICVNIDRKKNENIPLRFWFLVLVWWKFCIFKKPAEPKPTGDDDDVDLFGSDDEEQNEETKKRLAEYASKKSKSKLLISNQLNV